MTLVLIARYDKYARNKEETSEELVFYDAQTVGHFSVIASIEFK